MKLNNFDDDAEIIEIYKYLDSLWGKNVSEEKQRSSLMQRQPQDTHTEMSPEEAY